MNIVWFSWKDLSHPAAGGAEVLTDIILSRLAADGHTVTLLTSSIENEKTEITRHGYSIIRGGGRLGVYLAARKYYMSNLRPITDIVIDECNTLPFMTKFYAGKHVKNFMFFHMLCRIIWFHELPKYLGWIGWILEPIYLKLLSDQKAIVVSSSTADDIKRQGFKARNISIISEAITLKPIDSVEAIKKFDQPTLLGLGAMRSMKQTIDQVTAFEIAKQSNPDLKLILAGNNATPYGKKVTDRVASSQYKTDITMLGHVSDKKRLELMQKSHVLLVTSVKEGWGLVVTEANSQGTPAVGYNVDGLRDSIREGETGYITGPNPTALASAAIELLKNPKNYKRMQIKAHKWSKQITTDRCYEDFKKPIDH